MSDEQENAENSAPAAESSGTEKPLIGGRYEAMREIGRGGMGVVYLARDTKLMRHVAVKRLTSKSSNTKVVQRRFLREAQTIASLQHINIVAIYDIGQDEKGNYITMEYVPGLNLDGGESQHDPPSPVNLDSYIKTKGPMDLEEARLLIIKICGALEYAHHQGIIHRDIKPSNILINPKFEPKLVDFGLARPIDLSKSEEITLEGTILGTPEYSAPEQWGDVKAVGVAADIYALGGVMWFALSGKVPRYFREAEAPVEVKDQIAQALSQRPQDRFANMAEFADGLRKAGGGSSKLSNGPPSSITKQLGAGDSQEMSSSRLWSCGACGQPSPDTAAFCVNCGASGFQECSVCKKQFRVGTQFCPHCGADVKNAEEAATMLETAAKQAEFMEYESAMESVRELASKNNQEAQRLTKEWRQVVLKRRNLLMDLDSAIRVFNLEKAVNVAVELKTMCPEECLSESQDFDVVVKFASLMNSLKQLLVEASQRAQEEYNLEKYEQSVEYMNRVFGREACQAVNDDILHTQTILDNALANAGFAIGWNCFSRSLEILDTVPPWRGGDQGERRIRLYTNCKESIEKREAMIDQVEQALRESRFSDALVEIRAMSEFRLPPNNSEMEPSPEDMDAHHRIVNIDKILTKTIEERVEQWVNDNSWGDIIHALTILKGGESGAWRRTSEKLNNVKNREVAQRYNTAVDLEKKGRMARAERAWKEFARIPKELVPANLYAHAREFRHRMHAHHLKRTTKLVRRGMMTLIAIWLGFFIYAGASFAASRLVLTPNNMIAAGVQFGLFVIGMMILRMKRWQLQEQRQKKTDVLSPRLYIFSSVLALSPLAYVVGDGVQWALGGEQHALKGVAAALVLWAIMDVIRRQGVRLPGGGAMLLSWLVAGGTLLFLLPKLDTLLAWLIGGVLHMILFVILQVIHSRLYNKEDPRAAETPESESTNSVVITRDPNAEALPELVEQSPQITPSGKPALTLGGGLKSDDR